MAPDPDGADTAMTERLARISAAPGLSVSVFFGPGSGSRSTHGSEVEAESYLLNLVEAHLRQARPEERGSVQGSVKALLHSQSR
ncbi:hypothetical protein [Methylobacterium sp. GXS13]|uniref:hypothetical protein n=1 Tax=Methylobacterium sp. GXS13 TaxID=1730094 RepID=UPI000AB30F49|nr:hypothetical protein [Methylobacterium sp. GXS13]